MIDREIDCVLKAGDGRKGVLYIGNFAGASNTKRLKELGVKFVLTVANLDVKELKQSYTLA